MAKAVPFFHLRHPPSAGKMNSGTIEVPIMTIFVLSAVIMTVFVIQEIRAAAQTESRFADVTELALKR
jgi:hypothetical protein